MSHAATPVPADEDAKLITLAAGARARVGSTSGAAVRDNTGRSYSGADVALPALTLTGLQLAVAQAVASGARGIEAAAIVAVAPHVDRHERALLSQAGAGSAPIWLADTSQNVLGCEHA